jgi:hypothetical protein
MADKAAWLIEETWSGHVHYVHRDFDARRWLAECDRLGGVSAWIRRREEREPFITKTVDEAMRFPTKAHALNWLAKQPHWMTMGDQHQIREHMWLTPNEGETLRDTLIDEITEWAASEDGPEMLADAIIAMAFPSTGGCDGR